MMFQQVAEFHRAFGQLVAASPQLPDADTRALRQRLLAEEVEEYMEADAEDDLVEIADALADIAYILSGTAVAYGIAPTGHPLPFADMSDAYPHLPLAGYRKHLRLELQRPFDAYLAAEGADDIEAIRRTLLELLGNVTVAAYGHGIPLRRVFEEVHASNMSKLGEDGKPIYRADGKVLKGPSFRRPDIKAVIFPNR